MNTVASVLMVLGALLTLVASVGLVRMPDVFLRMASSAKAGTLGVGLVLLGVALVLPMHDAIRALAALCFLFLTAPVAAHRLGRAAYLTGARLWSGTREDQWKDPRRPVPDDAV